MILAVEIRFPLGRYHATPWDRHVNEGAIEWPPSPWRLTRALYAVWKERCPDLLEADVGAALAAISASPSYHLPRWRSSATRHYYPPGDHLPPKKGPPGMVIDAFVALDSDAPLVITWEGVDLPAGAGAALSELVAALPFLGRADSVCEAALVQEPDLGRCTETLVPDEDGGLQIAVPVRPLDLAALTITTDAMRKARLRQPAGMTHVSYPEPMPDTHAAAPTAKRPTNVKAPHALVYSVSGKPAPSHLLTVAVADTFLAAAQSRYERLTGEAPPPVLTGHPPDGQERRTDQHQHAHVFALPDESGSGMITRLVVWAKEGFGPTDAAVLGQLTELRLTKRANQMDGDPRSRSVVRGFGPTRILLTQLGEIASLAPAIGGPASRWTSVTPFVPTRHQKDRHFSGVRTGPYFVDFLTAEIERELAYRRIDGTLAGPVRVIPDGDRTAPAQRYRRHRLKHGLNAARAGVWLEFDLDRQVPGPIALGALSHYGLGLFRAGAR